MKRRLFGAVAVMCLFAAFAAPVAESDPARSAPMQFALYQESGACGTKCRLWVSATGMIRPETARDFEIFAGKHDLRGMMLALNSEGGSVHGAIALGRAIRRLDMTTTVGRSIEATQPAEAGGRIAAATLSPRADCESMCAFVLLGGTRRFVPNEARVRVHQIWLGDRRDDAAAATYSAEDLVLVQRDIGKLAQYTIELGGSAELLEVSLRIPPWEPMRSLTREQLRRMNLDNSDAVVPRPSVPQTTTVTPSPAPLKRTSSLTNSNAGSPANALSSQRERGWVMAERSGETALTRRHPLTVDGEDIGSFDLSFACGDSANEFVVFYREVRRLRQAGSTQPLKDIGIRLANRTIPLTLGVSRLAADSGGQLSTASGKVPASLVRHFASSMSRSLTVETAAADSDPTVIRIGNTGAAKNLLHLTTSCGQQESREHARLQPASE